MCDARVVEERGRDVRNERMVSQQTYVIAFEMKGIVDIRRLIPGGPLTWSKYSSKKPSIISILGLLDVERESVSHISHSTLSRVEYSINQV